MAPCPWPPTEQPAPRVSRPPGGGEPSRGRGARLLVLSVLALLAGTLGLARPAIAAFIPGVFAQAEAPVGVGDARAIDEGVTRDGGAVQDVARDGAAIDVANADAGILPDARATSSTPADAGREALVPADGGASARPAVETPPASGAPSPSPSPAARLVAVEGRVLAKGTRQPLAGASLLLDGRDAGETDEHGHFRILADAKGQQLLVQHPGYAVFATRVPSPGGNALTLRLAPKLSGERYITEVRTRPTAPSVHVGGEEARQTPGSANDPFRVIGTLPGVSQVAWPAAVYVVRGANPGNTGFFVDGVRVPALFHLGLGPSVIHPYLIEGLDFYPGAYPAAYGRYVSGIVAARTSNPLADRVHASADVTVYDAGGVVTTPIDRGRGTFAAAGRYSYTGAILSLVQSTTTLGYADYQLRLDERFAGGLFTAFALGSWDEVGWVANMQQQGVLQFHRVDLRYSHALLGGRLLVGTTVGHDRATSTLFYAPINVRSYEVAPRFTYDRSWGNAVDLKLGGDTEIQHFDTTKPPFSGQQGDFTRGRNAVQIGAHVSLGFRLGAHLRLVPGLRLDSFQEEGTTRTVPQPRLSLFVNFDDAWSLEGGVGRFAQMPSLPVSVPGFESFGLKSLGLQTGDAVSLAVRRETNAWQASVTGFFQRMRLSDIRNTELEGMNPTRPDYLILRDGTSYGLETMLRKRNEGRAFGWLAYTLSWSRRAIDGVVGPSDFDQRHILNLVGGYRLDGGYTLGARLHLHTGRYAPIFGKKSTPEDPETYKRLPTYTQLDLRAERRFVFDKLQMDLFLDLGNVAFQREVIEWALDGQGRAQPRSLHIILPTLGVHLIY